MLVVVLLVIGTTVDAIFAQSPLLFWLLFFMLWTLSIFSACSCLCCLFVKMLAHNDFRIRRLHFLCKTKRTYNRKGKIGHPRYSLK